MATKKSVQTKSAQKKVLEETVAEVVPVEKKTTETVYTREQILSFIEANYRKSGFADKDVFKVMAHHRSILKEGNYTYRNGKYKLV